MIIGNTLTEVGDVFYIYSQCVVSGSVTISGYTDQTVGETGTRYFLKTFRYSFDGLSWSGWLPLNNINLQQVTGETSQLMFFEWKYERGGTDTTGVLEFNGITLNGNIVIHVVQDFTTLESIFEDIAFNNALTSAVCNNLIKKIYNSGILPEYIDRRGEVDDKDFISFWSAICCFLAFVSVFADELDDILFKRKYLREYIKQQGVFFCENELPFPEIQFIANNLYDEIRKRGTIQTYKKKGDVLQDGTITPIVGEWLRILCPNRYDEFLVDVIEKSKHGYCIGQSSPLYNGNYKSKQINKTEENTEDFVDITKYEIFNPSNVSIITEFGTGKKVLYIQGDSNNYSGLGYDCENPPMLVNYDNLIIIDREIDYEVTFQIRRVGGSGGGSLRFGIHTYNYNGAYKQFGLQQITNNVTNNLFFDDTSNKITKTPLVPYSVRGIIYAENSPNVVGKYSKTNTVGQNLKFASEADMVKIFLQVKGNVDYTIHDFKMRPLIKGKSLLKKEITNPQFLHGDGLVMNWLKNNNELYTDSQVENRINEFILPYENKLIPIFTTLKIDDKQLLNETVDD